MQIETLRFGQIEVQQSLLVDLDEGLIGFPEERRFCILEDDRWGPMRWLQSVDRPDLAFLVVNPYEFFAGYEVLIEDDLAEEMALERPDDAAVLSLVSIQEEGELTANLLGPLVINSRTGRGVQLALNSDCYSTRHSLGKIEPKKRAGSAA
jgi:flagellar assembly factor FliW